MNFTTYKIPSCPYIFTKYYWVVSFGNVGYHEYCRVFKGYLGGENRERQSVLQFSNCIGMQILAAAPGLTGQHRQAQLNREMEERALAHSEDPERMERARHA